jgi:hypothetical protein
MDRSTLQPQQELFLAPAREQEESMKVRDGGWRTATGDFINL